MFSQFFLAGLKIKSLVFRESVNFLLGTMAVTVRLMATMVALLGIISFIIGVIAENKKVKTKQNKMNDV